MTATYASGVFASVDGYGSYRPPGDWGGYWGKQGPESTVDPGHDWLDATVARGDAVDVVTRLKEESDVPLRSHGSLSLTGRSWARGSSTSCG